MWVTPVAFARADQGLLLEKPVERPPGRPIVFQFGLLEQVLDRHGVQRGGRQNRGLRPVRGDGLDGPVRDVASSGQFDREFRLAAVQAETMDLAERAGLISSGPADGEDRLDGPSEGRTAPRGKGWRKEEGTENPRVGGSTPSPGTIFCSVSCRRRREPQVEHREGVRALAEMQQFRLAHPHVLHRP